MAARHFLTALVLVVGLTTGAFAQSDRGTITGTVVDPDGSVVPGASVVAENPENGARYETVTTQTAITRWCRCPWAPTISTSS